MDERALHTIRRSGAIWLADRRQLHRRPWRQDAHVNVPLIDGRDRPSHPADVKHAWVND
jgi:hypothetical protein